MRGGYLAALAALVVLSGGIYTPPAVSQGENKDQPLYKVVDGNKVDPETLKGFRAWRAAACERCHGPTGAGAVGPSLLESMKVTSKEEFEKVVLEGRPVKGMPGHANMKTVAGNIDGLYAYLKGRSDGAIKPGRLQAIGD